MLDALKGAFAHPTPDVIAAVIGALATVLAATLGALAVFWQIGRQAQSARRQEREAKSLSLKVDISELVAVACSDASNNALDLMSYVRGFGTSLELYRALTHDGVPFSVPQQRPERLRELFEAVTNATGKLLALIERWEIIDERLYILRIGVSSAAHDVREAWIRYFQQALIVMPRDHRVSLSDGPPAPRWTPPTDEKVAELNRGEDRLANACLDLSNSATDVQVEMQALLLGEIFPRSVVARRVPLDPNNIVLRIDQHRTLLRHFEEDTSWGRQKKAAEDRVKGGLTAAVK